MSFPGAQSAGSLGPLPKGWPEPISLPRPLGYRYWYRETRRPALRTPSASVLVLVSGVRHIFGLPALTHRLRRYDRRRTWPLNTRSGSGFTTAHRDAHHRRRRCAHRRPQGEACAPRGEPSPMSGDPTGAATGATRTAACRRGRRAAPENPFSSIRGSNRKNARLSTDYAGDSLPPGLDPGVARPPQLIRGPV